MNLQKFARHPLTFGPSPITALPRLSAHLGGKVHLYAKREDCNNCLDCFVACPEQQVIRMPLKGASKGVGPMILDSNCTNCGRCIDVCSKDVFTFVPRFAPNEAPTTSAAPQPPQ